jgi:hypothetical protein
MNIESNNKNRYLTCAQWVKEHSWPPIGGLRHFIFFAEQNGFDKVVRRCGRRVLISEQDFFKWVETNNNNKEQLTT